ncbi:1271_t:CDS:2 [Dentiscutata erythropus]|uniref:1271_t:CDS:1 n=1 Tax=Dentiscutata erythropus TaxID=1348616 RepID=A0A9N8Z0D7_9GLOM|nr:1271_t:CDS:2 [Dentiscutata erythropus]
MTMTSDKSIRKIKLVRNNIISLDSVNSMKSTIKTMLHEAEQESPDGALDGAIKVVTLIDTCIEILKSKGFYYKQTNSSGQPIIHDSITNDFAILDIQCDDNESGVKIRNSNTEIQNKVTTGKGNGRYDHVIKNGSKKISVQTDSKRTLGRLNNVSSVQTKSKRVSKQVFDRIEKIETKPNSKRTSKKVNTPLVPKRTSKKVDDGAVKIPTARTHSKRPSNEAQLSKSISKPNLKEIFDRVDIPKFSEKSSHIPEFIYPFSFKKDFIDTEFPQEQSPNEEFDIAKLDHMFVNPFAEIYGDDNNGLNINGSEVESPFRVDASAVNTSIPSSNMQFCTESETGHVLENSLSKFGPSPFWADIMNFNNIGIDPSSASCKEIQNLINANDFNIDNLTNSTLNFNENAAINNAINFNMNQPELGNENNMVNAMNDIDNVFAYQMETFMGALALSDDNNTFPMLNTGGNNLSEVFMPTIVPTDTNNSDPTTSDNLMDIDINSYINDMSYSIDEFNTDGIIPSEHTIGIDALFHYDGDVATGSGYSVDSTVVNKKIAPKTKRRKRRTHIPQADESANPDAPKIQKSFVFKSGKVGKSVAALVKDMRKVMEPNTAIRLKERKRNRLKDFVSIAGPLGVTQFLIFTCTDNGTNLRLTRTPRGPTLCFKVLKYSLIGDVLASQINPKNLGKEYNSSPLLVLNNFGEEEKHMKLMINMFQNMFPSINVNKIRLSEARRVVLFNYNTDTKHIDFRHYNIDLKPAGLSKSVRRIVSTNVPNLHKYNDISEYVLREEHVSESEVESGVEATVTLAQELIGSDSRKSDKRVIKLREIGPRMELLLVKIQAGLCDGEILYHEFVHKTPEEIKKIQNEREQRKQLAALRRMEQERNVERKKAEKEAHRLATNGEKKGKLIKEQEQMSDNEESDVEESDIEESDIEDSIKKGFQDDSEDQSDSENDSEDQDDDDDDDNLDDEFSDLESERDDMDDYSKGIEDNLFKVDDDDDDDREGDSGNDSDVNLNLRDSEKSNKNQRQKRKFDSLKGKPKFSMKIGSNKRRKK